MGRLRSYLALWLCLAVAGSMLLQGCDGCNTRRLRRFGSTCGTDAECAGGVCFRGLCTRSCNADTDCNGGICIASVCQTGEDDFDGDGISNALELMIGTNPQKKDSDGDGIDDKTEIGNVTSPKDANNDGIPDALQSNTKDSDGDCMVDSVDVDPVDPKKFNLPDPKIFCDTGICANDLASVILVCDKKKTTYAGVVLGCKGCQCRLDVSKVPDWQAKEQLCDGIDNDCDGLTDEDLLFDNKKVGQACVGIYGICAQADNNGVVPKGVVQCGSDLQITCSVHGNGTQSVAKPERCNFLDDDCDGATDENFRWKSNASAPELSIGASCSGCDSTPRLLCPDGKTANPAVVACSGDAAHAVCSSVPYADGFIEAAAGRPQPRLVWSAAIAQKSARLLVYGGAVPTPRGSATRAELWALSMSPSSNRRWTHLRAQPPGAVHGAAMVYDAKANRTLLLGGKIADKATTKIWSLTEDLNWAEATDVPALPLKAQGIGLSALIVSVGGQRRLVLFTPGPFASSAGAIHWLTLDGSGGGKTWTVLAAPTATTGFTALNGAPGCLVRGPGESYALAISAAKSTLAGAIYRLQATATGVAITQIPVKGTAPTRQQFSCTLSATGVLRVFGGHGDNTATVASARQATFDQQSPNVATWAQWSDDPTSPLATIARSGAWVGRVDSRNQSLILGGYRRAGGGTQPWHRRTAAAPLALPDGATEVAAADVPTPRPRIGAASGHSAVVGLCIAAGLGIELPDEDKTAGRVIPLTDAWCADAAGNWKTIATGLPVWAFGISGLDPNSPMLVMAGGLKLAQNQAVLEVWRIWRIWKAGIFQQPVLNVVRPAVAKTVYRLSLATGIVDPTTTVGPEIAASGVAIDRVGGRLLSFAGFNSTDPTDELWVLNFATMTWKNLTLDYPPNVARPLRGYGHLTTYHPALDTLIIAGGASYETEEIAASGVPRRWGLKRQVYPEAGQVVAGDECAGPDTTILWRVPTRTLPRFAAIPVPTYADIDGKTAPKQPLLRLHFGQPAFTPVLYDSAGARGLLMVQPVWDYKTPTDQNKNLVCTGQSLPKFTEASIQIRLNLGICGGTPTVFLEAGKLTTVPDSVVLAVGHYDDESRRSWLWSGVDKEERFGSGLWYLSQQCQQGAP